MRRLFSVGLGILELTIGVALVAIGLQLPTSRDISATVSKVGQVTGGTERQVRLLRDEVTELRRHDLTQRAEKLRLQTRLAADTATQQQVDFRTVEAIARSLGDVSKGLNAWAETVDAERMKKISTGLGATATYLDTHVVGASEKTADDMDRVVAALERDGARLAEVLRKSPADLKAVRSIHDGLAGFGTGLDKLDEMFKPDRLTAMRDGLSGMETSLSSTAEQVDKVSGLSYPVVTFNGLKPNVDTKPFWPDGEKVADGLRKATKGVKAANQEVEVMAKNLPEVRKSLDESRKAVRQARESLGAALQHQAEAEKLMKAVPEQTAAVAEALPKLAKTLSASLRETRKLRDLAAGLRAVQQSLDGTLKGWPDVAGGLKKSATVLESARSQLDVALAHRGDYEKAMESSSQVARSFAELLPLFTDQLDSRLGQQEASLEQMETGLADLNATLPQVERQANDLVGTIRLLLYLVAALVCVHGGYVVLTTVRPMERPTP